MSANATNPKSYGFATKAIHVGHNPDDVNSGCVIPPIVTSTIFKQDAPTKHRGFKYGRSGNPSRAALETCLASLDNGKYGLCFASGLGVSTCILSLLNQGDHVILGDDLYGGTSRLFRTITEKIGVTMSYVDFQDPKYFDKAITKNTKMVWIETPTNPLLRVINIKEVAKKLMETPQIILVVDNTFLTPYFQRPLELGAHICMYSLTKYMNGHSDVIMGAAITNDPELYEKLKFFQNALGIVPSPVDCYQVNRSLKTLALRMERHMQSALFIAEWLEKHPMVENVFYPGLPSHPQYELSKSQTSGHSGMLSFNIKGGMAQSTKFLTSLKVLTLAESLGGVESLAELPSVMTHSSIPDEQRARLGITDSLIRLSIGLEDVIDLVEDLDRALLAAGKV